MKKAFAFLLFISITLFLTSCSNISENTITNSQSLQVYTSFNALYEFASVVGQDKVEVHTIIPAGSEPHDFEPKAADIAGLNKADVFLYQGLGMEAWAEHALEAAKNDRLTVIIASDGTNVIEKSEEEQENGRYDPHTWLSIKETKITIQNIADGFSTADPDNKEFYQANAAEFIHKLEGLYNEYAGKFAVLEEKHFVTGHAAFHYFCRDFGLELNSVEDVFAEGEPSPQQLARLVEYCKENKVTTIFAEELASPAVSQTLANEVKAKVQTIYTMENPEDKLSYFERIKANCERVYQSLAE